MPPREIRRYDGTLEIHTPPLPRAKVAKWLEALVVDNASTEDEALGASMVAIQTASLLPEALREHNYLGDIVLTADGNWVAPDPDTVFLGGGRSPGAGALVHPRLEADTETLGAMKELGIKPASPESMFKEVARDLLKYRYRDALSETEIGAAWSEFWRLSRNLDPQVAAESIRGFEDYGGNWRGYLRVRTFAGRWRSLFNSLLPGGIVPADGSRDDSVAIDVRFHEADLPLLRQLGAVDAPLGGHELSQTMKSDFTRPRQVKFAQRDLPQSPQQGKLNFTRTTTSGPLDVLALLSDKGKALYTWRLLGLDATYEQWTMQHDTRRDIYPPMHFQSPAVAALRK